MKILNDHSDYLSAFLSQAKLFPDRIAVSDEYGNLTYDELNLLSGQLAARIAPLSHKAGARVFVYLPRQKEIIVSAFGVWKTGGVYIPADHTYPAGRLEYMAKDANAAAVITTRKLWETKSFGFDPSRIIFTDDILYDAAHDGILPAQPDMPVITPDTEAMILYTSGSTGKPKGVVHTHRSLYSLVNWQPDNEKPATESSRFANVSSITFIPSVTELFSALLCGGSTHIVTYETRENIGELYNAFTDRGITNIITSTRLGILLAENFDMRPFELRIIGERVPSFRPLYPSVITELYGSTEGCYPLWINISGSESPMPLGKPREGVRVTLIDEELRPVSAGQVGELMYTGDIMAKEYLNLPEQTAEKWVIQGGTRWYRTGDLIRMDAKGTLYFVQRRDFMIKLRGFRIEPGEVEKQVIACGKSLISGAVCVSRQIDGEDRLCCYYEADADIDISELKHSLSGVLADYMIPESWTLMDKLPRNANGKLDRNSLPDPDPTGLKALTSLDIIRIAADANRKYGISISPTELIRIGTRAEIDTLIKSKAANKCRDVSAAPILTLAPLSASQRGVFADCAAEPDSLRYNLPMLLRVPGSVSAESLKSALVRVLQAHPYVNVRLETGENGETVQHLENDYPEDYRIGTVSIPESELKDYVSSLIKPFDPLLGSCLYRLTIIRTETGCRLFSDFHHLIFDGSSYNQFYGDLIKTLHGEPLAPEIFTAMHLANEQKNTQLSELHQKSLAYWKKQLSQLDSASSVLPDRYDSPQSPGIERKCVFFIPCDDVRGLAKKLDCRTIAVYMSAFIYLVSAYTGSDTIGIVTVSGGRSDLRITEDYGMFVHTLPIIAKINNGNTADYVLDVQKLINEAVLNESCTYSEMTEGFDYTPEIMFAFQTGLIDLQKLTDEGFSLTNLEQGTAKFPLFAAVTENSDEAVIELRYDENRYSENMIREMGTSLCHIIRQLCVCRRLFDISYCDPSQQAALDAFNPAADMPAETETVVSMFRKAAAAYPDNTALVFMDHDFTYRELDEKTDRIAAKIEKRILGRNTTGHEPVVSILVSRSENMVIAAIASLKAGCAYQPLDPGYPEERLTYMVKDACPVLLINDRDNRNKMTKYAGDMLYVEEFDDYASSPSGPTSVIRPDDLFILLYTSGSTGLPKGVMLEHGNLVAFCRWYRRYYALTPDSRVAGYASFGFDACMMDLYPALTTGACVYIIPEEMRLDLDAINDYFTENMITHSFMTTQVGVQFYQTQTNTSLKHFSVGGEKLVALEPTTSYALHNGYGPTECTIFSVVKHVTKYETNIPIGRPVDTLKCYVVDKQMRRLPIGAPGELILSGRQVGRGYLNLALETSRSFFDIDGERAYHTGDIVRYRGDGDIEFVGRKDGQVKIRGFRVELKEVEAVIRQYPGITDTTVQAVETGKGGRSLAAYIVADDSVTTESLKTFILERKPAYMLPSSVIRLEKIPLTINQKVDRRKLPKPTATDNTEFIPPESRKGQIVADIVSKLLCSGAPVNMSESFSSLGGDSISAIRFVTMLRNHGLDIQTATVLQLSTLSDIAEAAIPYERVNDNAQTAFTGLVESSAIVRYFYDLDLPKPEHFNQAMLYKSSVKIDTDVLRKALSSVTLYHDMLRAVSRDGGLLVRDPSEGPFFTLDETGEPTDKKIEELESSIDLYNGPLTKACVFHKQDGDYLLIVIHHLVVDGVSWRIIAEDLNTAYASISEGRKVRFPAKTDSYDTYAKSLKFYKKSRSVKLQLDYWKIVQNKLFNTIRSDRSKAAISRLIMKKTTVTVDPDISKRILTVCNTAYGTYANELMLAALGLAYYRMTELTSISIRLEGHGREQIDTERCIDRTVGWFTSVFPVVLDNLDADIRTVIRETKENIRHIPEKGFGYPHIFRIETGCPPLLTFNYLGNLEENGDNDTFTISDAFSVGSMISPENKYGTDINFNGMMDHGRISFTVDYNAAIISAENMNQFCDMFLSALSEIDKHTRGVITPEKTASDYMDYALTDEEFIYIQNHLYDAGFNLLALSSMTDDAAELVRHYVLFPEDTARPPVFRYDILGSFNHSDFSSALQDSPITAHSMEIIVPSLNKPRYVLTDRKPEIQFIDISDSPDPETAMNNFYSVFLEESASYLHQPLMQLALVRTSAHSHSLFISMHPVFNVLDIGSVKSTIFNYVRFGSVNLFHLLAKRARGKNNLKEIIDSIENRELRICGSTAVAETVHVSENNNLQDYVQGTIAEFFSILLGIDMNRLKHDSNFFDLGGDRYTCVMLCNRLNTEFSTDIFTPTTVMKHPTVGELAEIINSSSVNSKIADIYIYSDSIVRTPLVFVHTANTGSEAYYRLAQKIKADYSFSVFEQFGLNHPDSNLPTIHDIAQKYIEILTHLQPHGPYFLGGWCFGGTVAYEMAQQLTKAGEEVSKLVLLDSHIIDDAQMRSQIMDDTIRTVHEKILHDPLLGDMRRKYSTEALVKNSVRANNAWLTYDPPEYEGSVLYFKATEKASGLSETTSDMYDMLLAHPAAGFEKRVSNLQTVPVKTDHDSMMDEEPLSVIVPVLKKYLG